MQSQPQDDVKYKNIHKFKKRMQFDNNIKKRLLTSYNPGRLDLIVAIKPLGYQAISINESTLSSYSC